MDDKADIGLVHTHAESDRSAHDDSVFQQEAALALGPHLRVKACMIGKRLETGALQAFSKTFCGIARGSIDDTAFARMRLHKRDHPVGALSGFRLCAKGEVGPVETCDVNGGGCEVEFVEDIVARALIGGRRDSDARHAWEQLLQPAKGPVVGAEIMAPLADAVGFINGDERDIETGQHISKPAAQRLRRDIEHVHLASAGGFERRLLVSRRHGGIEPLGAHAKCLERIDLVGHERNEGRDDQPRTSPENGRNLVTERLAASSRQDSKDIAPLQHIADDIGLQAAKRIISIDTFQKGEGVGQFCGWDGFGHPFPISGVAPSQQDGRGGSTGLEDVFQKPVARIGVHPFAAGLLNQGLPLFETPEIGVRV